MDIVLVSAWFAANWFYFLGVVLSFVGALGFLTFLRGFGLGLNQIFYIDGHAEHVNHARIHAVQGLVIMVQMFVIWVVIKMAAAFLGFGQVNMALGFWILFVYSLLALLCYYKGFWPSEGGGGHH
jgi:hypothetical protein